MDGQTVVQRLKISALSIQLKILELLKTGATSGTRIFLKVSRKLNFSKIKFSKMQTSQPKIPEILGVVEITSKKCSKGWSHT